MGDICRSSCGQEPARGAPRRTRRNRDGGDGGLLAQQVCLGSQRTAARERAVPLHLSVFVYIMSV